MTKPRLPRRPLLLAALGVALGTSAPAWAQLQRAWLGVELAPNLGVDGKRLPGAVARRVLRGSPAELAGLKDGDVVLTVDDLSVSVPGDVVRRVAERGVGAKLRIVAEKSQTKKELVATLVAHPGELAVAKRHLVGAFAPAWRGVTRVKGDDFDPKSHKGKVVLLSFWASWCGACREMVPVLAALDKELGAEGLRVVGLTDESESVALRAADKHGMTYRVGATTSPETLGDYLVRALPTLVLIDKAGKVRDVFFGSVPASELRKPLKLLLAEKV